VLGENADDRGRHAVDEDGTIEYVRVGIVARAPQAAREHRDPRRSRPVVVGREHSTDDDGAARTCRCRDLIERIRGDVRGLDAIG
jgi:hypothetical protein